MNKTNSPSQPQSNSDHHKVIVLLVSFVATAILIFAVLFFARTLITKAPATPEADPPTDVTPSEPSDAEPEPPAEPAFIDLQPIVDQWVASTNGQVGLMLYDLDHQAVAASYHADEVFNVASIYKLFFVYDGYRELAKNPALDDPSVFNLRTYDYRAGNYRFSECLDLMIRESYNGCADPFRADPEKFNRATALINELGLEHTSSAGLYSTAADLAKLLELYYYHADLSPEAWAKISDSMLAQPPTAVSPGNTYDWRQGLPAGFSEQAKVYNKVGWAWNSAQNIWTVYADAAILEFPAQNRHYTAVVLTQNFPDYQPISQLGTLIEEAVLKNS